MCLLVQKVVPDLELVKDVKKIAEQIGVDTSKEIKCYSSTNFHGIGETLKWISDRS
jgi:hypothetical protein